MKKLITLDEFKALFIRASLEAEIYRTAKLQAELGAALVELGMAGIDTSEAIAQARRELADSGKTNGK